MLCSLSSDPKLVSKEFLQLVFQLKHLDLSQLRTLWQETSFKCRNDWRPLLDALPACGSDHCILLLSELMRSKELEEAQARSFLTTIALTPHPSPPIIGSISALLEVPELRTTALLAGSSLAYQLCRKSQRSCSEHPQIQTFIQALEDILKGGCEGQEPTRVSELFYALKSVGNAGLSASSFAPLLSRCMLDPSAALELRLAAVQAFRRFPCSADLYCSSQEDSEVRIAAYQQLMRCPDRQAFEAVKTMLKSETSSQVGSFVWSHLTNVLRSEDPMKQALIESLPDDIISRDFEAEFFKFSSYSDYTVASGMGITNVETSLIFSPKSFLPRSASANVTVYFHGRAHNLLEVELHVENAEQLLKKLLGHEMETEPPVSHGKQEARRARRRADDGDKGEKETCLSGTSFLNQAKEMGNEVQLNHRALLATEELLLPSLAGVPIKLGINITSLLSLHLKGNVNYRDIRHFSLNGYVKPSAHAGLSARFGVDSALGAAAVEWAAELNSSTSLDGSVQMQEGRDVRVTLNTPEDLMDVISVSSRVFQLSGDHREEIKGPKTRVQKTTCTQKAWSKMIGWQLCSNTSYPSHSAGLTLPPSGPVFLSLRLLKLDRGLSYYLLEAAYSLLHQRSTWLPREASIHLLLATPQSSIPRDMSLDLALNPRRLLLRITHPLKTILIQGPP
ncbi:vitellogenin-like [Salarias fasciatus]|uniref:vitellogenin-like n=1 Tax=Salarias fasciatus TaxID=181472 RepID=UPI001176C483|nr:vitellogenin-like [Salarias fasciatus]